MSEHEGNYSDDVIFPKLFVELLFLFVPFLFFLIVCSNIIEVISDPVAEKERVLS